MKLGKSASKKEYSKLLTGFDKAKASYKEAKKHETAVKKTLKEEAKNLSKLEIKALILLVAQAKHVSKAEKINVKIAKLLIKQWNKASAEAATTELKQQGKKAKAKSEAAPVEAAEAPAPKKRGRQPKVKVAEAVEVAEIVETTEVAVPKKRGRQPKAVVAEAVEAVEVAEVAEVVETTEVAVPKKRGRQPKAKVDVAEVADEAATPKKTRQKKEKVEGIVEVADTVVDVAPKRRGRQPKVEVEAEVEEGVAGVSARAMEAADATDATDAPVEPVEPVAETREKKPRRSREEIAAQKAAEADAAKAALKGDDFRIIEGVGPKVTALLHENGIFSFQDLAEKSYDELKALMMAHRQYLAKPHNWAQQAQLAAEGKMEELEALKATLKAGV